MELIIVSMSLSLKATFHTRNDVVTQLYLTLNVQRFRLKKKSEEKNDATKVEAWMQLLLMKVFSSVKQIADALRAYQVHRCNDLRKVAK